MPAKKTVVYVLVFSIYDQLLLCYFACMHHDPIKKIAISTSIPKEKKSLVDITIELKMPIVWSLRSGVSNSRSTGQNRPTKSYNAARSVLKNKKNNLYYLSFPLCHTILPTYYTQQPWPTRISNNTLSVVYANSPSFYLPWSKCSGLNTDSTPFMVEEDIVFVG